jgi:hypothetical protein
MVPDINGFLDSASGIQLHPDPAPSLPDPDRLPVAAVLCRSGIPSFSFSEEIIGKENESERQDEDKTTHKLETLKKCIDATVYKCYRDRGKAFYRLRPSLTSPPTDPYVPNSSIRLF